MTMYHDLQAAEITKLHTYGAALVVSATAPSPYLGLQWLDTRTNELLTWDGTYWTCGGGLVRVETVLTLGVVLTKDYDAGWAPPTGFAVHKASMRILTTITADGGALCKKVGFGTKAAGDPDKYGLSADLIAGTTTQILNPTWNNGAADDLAVTACDVAGASGAGETMLGSVNPDIRLMVWMSDVKIISA